MVAIETATLHPRQPRLAGLGPLSVDPQMLVAVRLAEHGPLGEVAVERDVAVDDMPGKMQRQVIDMPAAASSVEDIESEGVGEAVDLDQQQRAARSEEQTSELQSLMRISYAVLSL